MLMVKPSLKPNHTMVTVKWLGKLWADVPTDGKSVATKYNFVKEKMPLWNYICMDGTMIKIILAVAWSVILVLLTYLTIAVVSLNGHLHILIGIAVPVAMLGFITICERPLDK
jgi:hypothetical protein